jgi:hypothetical protein
MALKKPYNRRGRGNLEYNVTGPDATSLEITIRTTWKVEEQGSEPKEPDKDTERKGNGGRASNFDFHDLSDQASATIAQTFSNYWHKMWCKKKESRCVR